MDDAAEWARSGADEGAVVVAETQTASRGRLGRRWVSDSGNLYFSVLFRPNADALPLLSPLAGVAVARSIRQVAGLYPAIKWPNDITIDGRKVAGILAESTMSGGAIEHAVVGVGINVALDVSRDPEIAATADSLDNLADSPVDRSELLRRILQHMDALYLDLRRGRSPIPEWRRWLDTLGQRVVVSHHGASNSGLAEDIDEHGNLLLRQDDGRLLTLTAGDITLRAERRGVPWPMLENLYLDGKVVVITGGGTGLGLEMVRALTRSGANLAIAGRRPGPIESARDEVLAAGQDAIAVPTDVSKSSDADALIQATLDHFGRVDVMINNAAMVADNVLKPIWEITDDDWESAMSVNLSGAFYCARAAAKPMADAGKGKIINVASGFGLRGGRDIYMYCTSKGGVIQLTRVLSFSLARYGITANSIVPVSFPPSTPAPRSIERCPNPATFCPPANWASPRTWDPSRSSWPPTRPTI